MKFTVKNTSNNARTGLMHTEHGTFETPVFMPVGTVGAVKTISADELENIDSQIILGNTDHLYLRPGTEVVNMSGGLHRFNSWNKPILTDSGGFQVFSSERKMCVCKNIIQFNIKKAQFEMCIFKATVKSVLSNRKV